MFWLLLFALLFLMAMGGTVYLVTRFHKLSFIKKMAEKHKLLSWLVCLIPLGAIGSFAVINVYAVIVVLLHLMIFWLIMDIIGGIIGKLTKKKRLYDLEGAVVILFTAVVLGFGWYNAHHVSRAAYTVYTDKTISGENFRIVGIADSHLGITLDGESFAKEMKKIQEEAPDIVVVAGDFVDDDSCRKDMVQACKALGELKTTCGVYFVFGNHDRGYYKGHRDFTVDDLKEELLKNNVVILEDDIAEVNDEVLLIGRKDKSSEERLDMAALTKDIDSSKLQIVIDHQPNDYDNEASAGADIVFSGHTHGGHIWPTGYVGLLIGANDYVYGSETRDNTEFIVTSGISGWAIPFKTGISSEYVVIDVKTR